MTELSGVAGVDHMWEGCGRSMLEGSHCVTVFTFSYVTLTFDLLILELHCHSLA